jgi:hypothetical protein
MEAISTANRVTLQSAETVARREMEIMQQTMGELSDSVRLLMSVGTPLGPRTMRSCRGRDTSGR